MKILVLANSDGGLFQFRRELLKELSEKNEIYFSVPSSHFINRIEAIGCIYIPCIFLDRRGLSLIKDIQLILYYRKIITQLKPDMVLTYTIKPNIYGGIVCRLKKILHAANITGLGTSFIRKGILNTVVTILYKCALKKTKVVFFENSCDREFFIQHKIVRKIQSKVLNGAGVNLDRFSLMPYPNNSQVKFLFIGRIMREKGINELLTAMKHLIEEGEKCFLDVIGIFEENYKDIFDQFELEGWLKYHGYQEDVMPFIAECDCFVLPSWHEGMANTNLECASSGRPIITSNIPGCKEALIDGVSGYLCEAKNATSLYIAMKRMIYTKNRKEMGLAGRKLMENTFDKRIVVKETIQALTC